MNKFNTGMASLTIVLILVGVVVVGGGVYVATKSSSEVAVESASPSTSTSPVKTSTAPTVSRAPLATTSVSKTPVPSISKSPVPPSVGAYTTITAAYNSGKSLTCVGELDEGKGPAWQVTAYFKNPNIKMSYWGMHYLYRGATLNSWAVNATTGSTKVFPSIDLNAFFGYKLNAITFSSCKEGALPGDAFTLPANVTF